MGNNTMLRSNKGITAYVLGLGLLGGVFSGGAYADSYACGAILDGGVHILTENVGPCDGSNPALTVVGPTTLQIENGVEIFCQDGDDDGDVPNGIVILGQKAKVIGGAVTGCDDGVRIEEAEEEGEYTEHLVKGMSLTYNEDEGMDIRGDGNIIMSITANKNGDKGFSVDGNRNKLTNNTANDNDDNGFKVDGDRNLLTNNTANGNSDDGFGVDGNRNTFIKNTANENKEDNRGFEVDGEKNLFLFGEARKNESDGFRLDDGNGNVVSGMNLSDNRDDGMEVNSDGNKILFNRVENNAEDGIQLSVEVNETGGVDSTADNNTVSFNVAKGNGDGSKCNIEAESPTCDLEDQNPDCGTNRWRGNKFGTSNQDCIQ